MARVANAEQQQMRRLNTVQGWLSRVEAMETEVGELMKDGSQEVDKLCPGGCCSKNCRSSFEFGKRVAKTLQLVNNLMGEGAFDAVAEKVPRPAVDQRPCEPTVGLESTFDKVWRCLGEEQVGIIGLYGMGGVGKTTLLTKINNKLLGAPNVFDVVIWVVVSKDLQLEKIQEKIGRRIGFFDESWKNGSLEDKTSDILRILGKKKFLLLLDDIWERVDLTKVGIPFPDPENKSKIVFTTHFLEICGALKAHEFLKVECLGPEDAWRLFRENLRRDVLDNHPDIPELARSVAQECAGLPLALITIGRAMACKKTPQEWHYAIQVLRRSASEFPDYRIRKSELIDCWIGEGFLDQYDRSGAYNEGYYIIGILLHACLLEEEGGDIGEEESGEHVVKMHDVIRDMVLWIACKIEKEKENFLVHAGLGLTEAPEIQNWRNVRRMSLMKNKIENLSETPTCPHLLSLFLSDNSLKMSTDDFFQSMPSLRVFNMSNNHLLWKLPSGISTLVSLEHLDLSSTAITHLPIELQKLVNLKCLNLEYMNNLNQFPRLVISAFSKLQVLRMFDCGGSKIERLKINVLFGGHQFLVEELMGMKHLMVLTITLKSWQALKELLISQELQRSTQSLFLRCFNDSKSLDIFCLAGLRNLNKLYVAGCKHLEDSQMTVQRSSMNQLAHGFHNLHTVNVGFCFKLKDLTCSFLLQASSPSLY
ncbi:Disease resistance protein SUMM2 [Citrus sinensis]|uniref:Disease resistance protein SUMM2 n=1 Tax=Citrus sinensis TaxID=2711 RepID=A0ACB8JBM7_CITSI|nr:Disease resistance protein SUMM2 [Citrus sinensis]